MEMQKMETWQGATESDREIYIVIRMIFQNHPKLLEFLFDKAYARLRYEPMEMWKALGALSGGEQILVRIAMDVWSGSGNAKLWRILEILDDQSLSNVLNALRTLRRLPPSK
jgi:hypothetical protein